MGEIRDDIQIYIEDYAYTYLKKEKDNIKAKYFLYGEKDQAHESEKIYIYGVSEKPKLEQTYFKEYYPVGFLKIKEDKAFWISLKGQEMELTGCYIFYAPNQAMQEYLIDNQAALPEERRNEKKRREIKETEVPMREVYIPARGNKLRDPEFHNKKFILPVSGIMIAALILYIISTPNGRTKVEILKEVMADTISQVEVKEEFIEEELIIEEISETKGAELSEPWIGEKDVQQESMKENADETAILLEDIQDEENIEEVVADEVVVQKESQNDQEKKSNPEEYIIQIGDTLVGICKKKYGTTAMMREICEFNKIENADYIAPGQKIYLP